MLNHADAVKASFELDEADGTQEELEINSAAADIISVIAGYEASDMMNEAGALDYIFELSREYEGNEKMTKAVNLASDTMRL